MNVIEEMTMHPLVQSLGWTLLHFVWQGSLVAAAFAAVNALLGERSANLRYAAASTAMLVMTACVPVTFYLVYSSQPVSPGVGVEPASSFETPELLRPVDGDSHRAIHLPPPVGSGRVLNSHSSPGQAVPSITTYTARDLLLSLLPWVVGFWVIGVLALSMRLLGAWACMLVLVRSRSRAASGQWCGTVDLLRKKLGIDRPIKFLETASVEVPVVFGWLRPALLLPVTAFTGLSPDQVEAILIHELAHIRRHDYLVNLLQSVAETLLFYHPAIWWISRHMRVEREYCCDDIASSQSKDTLTYVTALSQLEERRGVALNLAVAAAGGSLLERVRRLCNVGASGSSARRPGLLGLLVMVALVSAVATYTSQGSENASADAESSTFEQTEGSVETQFTSYSTEEAD
ncbi:MAG: M56 family metallopeptidase, partial [Gemmatimonadetes bacterium]|nr:M56 family metallopeptidase [Gemmatimonadota bacterium]